VNSNLKSLTKQRRITFGIHHKAHKATPQAKGEHCGHDSLKWLILSYFTNKREGIFHANVLKSSCILYYPLPMKFSFYENQQPINNHITQFQTIIVIVRKLNLYKRNCPIFTNNILCAVGKMKSFAGSQ